MTLTACGSDKDSTTATTESTGTTATTAMASSVSIKNASDLRARLNYLLGDHLILAAKATGSALAGNSDEFNAYATQLNTNGTDVGALIGAAYGSDAQTKFNGIWSAHNGFFVDYTNGVAKQDKAAQDKAVADLTGTYVPQFTDFLVSATGLPADTVKGLVTEHVTGTKAVVADQYAKNYTKEVTDTRAAYAHMKMMGDPIADAIAKKFPDKFPASSTAKASDLRTTVDQALQEHLYLATFATDSALAGRTAEFTAWSDALNKNGTEIGALLGSVYGTDAQTKFNGIWSAHNGFFVDYTTGVAKQDKAAQDKAVADLTGTYVPQFTDFIVGATGLPQATVTELVTAHVTGTKAVVDDQYAKSWTKAAADDRAAAMHMQMIGDPLADAIVKKFPDKFSA
jgi:DNA-binding ferritin-like protein (Dps family)